jgi:hypothetical protein
MRFAVGFAALTIFVSSCSPSPLETKITPELLDSPEKIAKVANRLPPAERHLFSRYVAGRMFVASGFGKPLTNERGKDPATVGEAIALVKQMDARHASADAFKKEAEKAEAAVQARLKALEEPMIASGYAAGPTNAHNAVVDEINALRKANSEKEAAIREGRLAYP